MVATIPPVRLEGELVSISDEQLVPPQSSVGVEEGRREIESEQSIPLQSSAGLEEGVEIEQSIPLQSPVGVEEGKEGKMGWVVEIEQSIPLQSPVGVWRRDREVAVNSIAVVNINIGTYC